MPGGITNQHNTLANKDVLKQEIKHEKELIKEEQSFQKDVEEHNKELLKQEQAHQKEMEKKEKRLLKQHNKEEQERLGREKELVNLQRLHEKEVAQTQSITTQTTQSGVGTSETTKVLGGLGQPLFSVQHPLSQQQQIPTHHSTEIFQQTGQHPLTGNLHLPGQQHTTEHQQTYKNQTQGISHTDQFQSNQNLSSGQPGYVAEIPAKKPGIMANIKHGIQELKADIFQKKEQQSVEKAVDYSIKADQAQTNASNMPHS